MIEVVKREDGLWTWRWSEGEQTFLSSKSFISPRAAEESATRAYPGAEVLFPGDRNSSETASGPGEPAGPSEPRVRTARKGRKRGRSNGRPPSRLVSLVVLVLAYLRTRSDSGSKGRRS